MESLYFVVSHVDRVKYRFNLSFDIFVKPLTSKYFKDTLYPIDKEPCTKR